MEEIKRFERFVYEKERDKDSTNGDSESGLVTVKSTTTAPKILGNTNHNPLNRYKIKL